MESIDEAKLLAAESLETIRTSLLLALESGMPDPGDKTYNQCVTLIEELQFIDTWDEMEGLIAQAKTLENEVAVWLSLRGLTTVSLRWPKRGPSQ